MPVFRLSESLLFPPPELARADGLLAVGGDLSVERLLLAYRSGIFPWYSPGEPILWWAPSPRCLLFPAEFRISRRFARTLRHTPFTVTVDTVFPRVIRACADLRREKGSDTWIDRAMIDSYCRLHSLGFAHSVECWRDNELAGGLYGVSLGGMFFGESMFSRFPDSSKVAMAHLVDLLRTWDFLAIDCQIANPHLLRLGAREIPGREFSQLLDRALAMPTRRGQWRLG